MSNIDIERIHAEKVTITEALKKIEQFIRENYIPRLLNVNSISVDFGELKRYPNTWKTEYEHSLSFRREGDIYYRTGGLSLNFSPDLIFKDRDIYDNWTWAKDLILYWQEVKRKVGAEFEKKEGECLRITNFEV